MTTCTAHEFVETAGRRGSMSQFRTALRSGEYGLKADISASIIPEPRLAMEYGRVAATLAFIAFPDLRA